MSLFKCKMCGGDLEVADGAIIAECEYCGTAQTLPKTADENLQNIFNRANTLRIKSEFDKAEKLYEKIIQADSAQAEAYWGLILCKYGIEYVDDPATLKKIPTCHRASYDSIIADDDYKSALANADTVQRAIYEQQAREIDRIQKEILTLAQREESYDVFICYKETDLSGKRTQDSVIANDIYHQLTQEGYRVFYATITLEGKLGSAYEPVIFAALHSAKVMLAIGTKPEYFNAVWVKNEWSRFLKIIKNDRSKLLIPCYRDIDAYELPEEFAHLQAQDMGKIGFINDIVRGIGKVISRNEPKQTKIGQTVAPVAVNANVDPLLKRAFMFLEDGEWGSADEYCEKVLDIDPENASAYLGKLMAELRVKKQALLKDCATPYDNRNNYHKAVRFGDDNLRTELESNIEYINTRNENARLEDVYTRAVEAMSKAETVEFLKDAAKRFDTISDYKDSAALAAKCRERAETLRKDDILSQAQTKMSYDTVYNYEAAIALLNTVPGWKNADGLVETCKIKIKEHKVKEEEERLERERKAEIARKEAERIAKRNKKIAIITTPIVCTVIAFLIVLNNVIIPSGKYKNAVALMETGKYDDAIVIFEELARKGYKDSVEMIPECSYLNAVTLMDAGKYSEAISLFEVLDGYKDSAEKINESRYLLAKSYIESQDYDNAIKQLLISPDYKDTADLLSSTITAVLQTENINILSTVPDDIYKSDTSNCYDYALKLFNSKNYSSAMHYFDLCKEQKDANKYSTYCSAKASASSGDWNAAATSYSSIKGFLDSDAEMSNAYYQQVVSSDSLSLDDAVGMLKSCTDGKGAELLKTCQYLQRCTGEYKCTERVSGTYTNSIKNMTFEMTFTVEKGIPSVNIYNGFIYHDTYIPTAPLTKTSGEYVYASTLKNEQIWFSQSKLKLVSDVFECSYYFAK